MSDYLFANPWTVACQISLSIEFSSQEYWSRLPFLTPVDLPDPRTETASPELADGFSARWEAKINSEFWIQKVWGEDKKRTWPFLRKEQKKKKKEKKKKKKNKKHMYKLPNYELE